MIICFKLLQSMKRSRDVSSEQTYRLGYLGTISQGALQGFVWASEIFPCLTHVTLLFRTKMISLHIVITARV